jgi:CubicO group peptidase (beta-lactamase class C family)
MTVTGSVGCAAVLVRGRDGSSDLDVVYSASGRSGRPGLVIARDTRFEIGSVTKVFTGLVLADMVIRGETELDATLGTLLGLPAMIGGKITLRSLATHTSGLPRLAPGLRMKVRVLTAHPDPYRDIDLAHVIAALTRNPPAEPGAFRYSNLGYQLLGAALAAAAGSSWPDLVWQRICRPLGMTATGIEPDRSTVRGHDRAGLPVPYWDSALLPAAGALLSSAADLEKFLRAQLDPASTGFGAAIRLSRVSHTEDLAVRPAGLGWMLDRTAGANLAWHNGGTGGFGAILAVTDRPGRPAGTAILVNSPHLSALDTVAREMLTRLSDE